MHGSGPIDLPTDLPAANAFHKMRSATKEKVVSKHFCTRHVRDVQSSACGPGVSDIGKAPLGIQVLAYKIHKDEWTGLFSLSKHIAFPQQTVIPVELWKILNNIREQWRSSRWWSFGPEIGFWEFWERLKAGRTVLNLTKYYKTCLEEGPKDVSNFRYRFLNAWNKKGTPMKLKKQSWNLELWKINITDLRLLQCWFV